MNRRFAQVAAGIAPPLLFGVLLLGTWEAIVRGFKLKPYFLVPPSAIGSRFVLVLGTIVGVLMAFLLSRFKVLDELITPMSIAVNAIPAFVLVSVFNNMFSTTSDVPRRLMVTLVVFFVVLVNVAKGLRQVDPTHAELMRSYAASNWDVLRKVRVPNAVPYLFTALKVAAPLSVIYAYVSEYFGGAQNGLGSRIASNIANSKNAVGWAYVLGACLLGLAFYLISVAVEAAVTPGGVTQRNRAGS
jgi:NitT/TauT family transport system permease protein